MYVSAFWQGAALRTDRLERVWTDILYIHPALWMEM